MLHADQQVYVLKIPMARAKVDRLEAGRRGGSCPTISLGTTTPEKIIQTFREKSVCAGRFVWGLILFLGSWFQSCEGEKRLFMFLANHTKRLKRDGERVVSVEAHPSRFQ